MFGEEVRPVKLRTVVRGYNPSKVDFLFERRLNEYVVGVVREFSGGKPALVFCKCARPAGGCGPAAVCPPHVFAATRACALHCRAN